MILSDIRAYLEQRGQATLVDLARRFDTDPSALEGMLERWVRKGRVRHHLASSACGSSCNKCDRSEIQVYEWVSVTQQPKEQVVTFGPIGCAK